MVSEGSPGWRCRRAGKTHLADVDVRTLRVDLGVVRVEHGGVDVGLGADDVARVVRRHGVGFRAILAGRSQADDLGSRGQVKSMGGGDAGLTWPMARLLHAPSMVGLFTVAS